MTTSMEANGRRVRRQIQTSNRRAARARLRAIRPACLQAARPARHRLQTNRPHRLQQTLLLRHLQQPLRPQRNSRHPLVELLLPRRAVRQVRQSPVVQLPQHPHLRRRSPHRPTNSAALQREIHKPALFLAVQLHTQWEVLRLPRGRLVLWFPVAPPPHHPLHFRPIVI